ncbi:MAG: Fe-S oxidoreductase [Rhodospirillaceae bacterium]|nr:Fe-S oxidoreductase [Rhodospirillaceae bacterium]
MEGTAEPGRELFQSLSPAMIVVFYAVAFASTAAFAYGIWRRVRKYLTAKPPTQSTPLKVWARAWSLVQTMAAHSTLRKRNTWVGLAHAMIFYGFLALFIGTTIIFIDHDILGLISAELRFWRGDFYTWFSLVLDLAGLALLLGLLFMAARRWIAKPARLDYARPDREETEYNRTGYRLDDHIFLWGLIILTATGLLLEALRIAIDFPPFEIWSVVGWNVARAFAGLGLTSDGAAQAHPMVWWGHAIFALSFIAYLPYSKASHMLLAAAGLFLRDPLAGKRLPAIPEGAEQMGYRGLGDFSRKELLNLDACTKCGRCHAACPAAASGAPLSPRDVVLELREDAESALGPLTFLRETKSKTFTGPIEGVGLKSETLWSCTTCLACVDICPVGVEHVPMIVQMRRTLVEQGDMDLTVQSTLENMMRFGNSFGAPEADRGTWTEDLDFEIKDARTAPVEYLWFVGDFASYDPAARKNTQKAARIFKAAGLDFGILYDGERNAGNDIRRVGEEGLFELLQEHNLAALETSDFKTIITTDPHSYNTLKHEYPDIGDKVRHYTEVIADLIDEGKITIKQKIDSTVTYHDPCHLSRYAGITNAPRRILSALGVRLVEMARHGTNSFCCGGGGGRIWMGETGSGNRPSDQRLDEAMSLDGVDKMVVACPKCFSMFNAALGSRKEVSIEIGDLLGLLGEATL